MQNSSDVMHFFLPPPHVEALHQQMLVSKSVWLAIDMHSRREGESIHSHRANIIQHHPTSTDCVGSLHHWSFNGAEVASIQLPALSALRSWATFTALGACCWTNLSCFCVKKHIECIFIYVYLYMYVYIFVYVYIYVYVYKRLPIIQYLEYHCIRAWESLVCCQRQVLWPRSHRWPRICSDPPALEMWIVRPPLPATVPLFDMVVVQQDFMVLHGDVNGYTMGISNLQISSHIHM